MMLNGCFLLVKEPLFCVVFASNYSKYNNVGLVLFWDAFIWLQSIKKAARKLFLAALRYYLFFEMGINFVE